MTLRSGAKDLKESLTQCQMNGGVHLFIATSNSETIDQPSDGFQELYEMVNTTWKGILMEKYPIILALHDADLEATKLMEDKNGDK